MNFNNLQDYKIRNNIDELVRRPNGLNSRQLRQRIWPKLLGIDRYQSVDRKYVRTISAASPHEIYIRQTSNGLISFTTEDNDPVLPSDTLLSSHRDCRTIHNDISRSLWTLSSIESDAMDLDQCLPKVKWTNDVYLYRNRLVLTNTILLILTKHPHLYYYQGYHDILSVVHICMQDPLLSYSVSEALTCRFLGDMMQQEFATVTLTLPLILTVIKEADVELYNVLVSVLCMPRPDGDGSGSDGLYEDGSKTEDELSQAIMFTLCNYITWFAHDIKKMSQICWVFDLFLSMPPDYSIYFTAALVISFKDEIVELWVAPGEDGEEGVACRDGFGRPLKDGGGCDYATMYTFLLNLTRPPKREEDHECSETPSPVRRDINMYHLIEVSDTLYQHIYPPSVLLSHVLNPPLDSPHSHGKCGQLIRSGTITIFNYLYDKKNTIGCCNMTVPTYRSDCVLMVEAICDKRMVGCELLEETTADPIVATVANDSEMTADCAVHVGDSKSVVVVKGEIVSKSESNFFAQYTPLIVSTVVHSFVLYYLLFTDSPQKH